MIDKLKNWSINKDGELSYRGNPIQGVVEADIREATKSQAIKTKLGNNSDLSQVLGAAWDCVVAVREKTAFPSSAHFSDVIRVSEAFKSSLGPYLFEKFLRPNNRVGLPPAK